MRTHLSSLLRSIAVAFLASSLLATAQDPVQDNPLEARRPPAWLRSGVIYEVFPRSFSQAGNLNGVTEGLDRLKGLGVTVIWLMPIHPVGQAGRIGINGSPYAVRDYYAIAPDYGTKEDLRRLVDEAHHRGMKVIMDIVADHTAYDSVMMTHPEFYQHDKQGQLISPHGWSDVAALDYTNLALRRYMIDALIYWVKDFGVDGYRCDAAGLVPTDFWEQARTELDRVHPDTLMLAEASKSELMEKAFDIDYAWPMLSKLDDVIERGAPATELHTVIEQQRSLFPKGSLHMMISDDHDELRALVRYGGAGALAASALIFTLDGVPLLYNGMEAGDATPSSGPALFDSLKICWASSQLQPEYQGFYAFMIPFRKNHPALTQGELIWLHNSDEQHVLSFERRSVDERVLLMINLSNTPYRGTVEVSGNTWKEVGESRRSHLQTALPAVSLDPFKFRIFTSKPGTVASTEGGAD